MYRLSFMICIAALHFGSCKTIHDTPHAVSHRGKRVIGGDILQAGDAPWLVRLRGKIPRLTVFGVGLNRQHYFCGASILNKRWLLTAAHCFVQPHFNERFLTPKYWHVKLGETDATTNLFDWLSGNRDCHLEEIRIHPNYNPMRKWEHDIAVVKVRHDIEVGQRLTDSVALPSSDLFLQASGRTWPETDAQCMFAGWGCAANGESLEEYAKKITLPPVSDHRCNRLWGVSTTTRLCAGFDHGNQGICAGDSGSPLMCPMQGTDGSEIWHYQQAGIASFTAADHPEDYPAAFTRVSHYKQWILDNIVDLE